MTATKTKEDQIEDQYKAVCDCEDCTQVLHEDMHIFIWNNNKSGNENEEMTICQYCHEDLEDELHEEGWTHDEEEDYD